MMILTNARWEQFAQAVAMGESATAAYRAIYGARRNADVFGPRLMGNDGIRARVAELQSRAASACVLTIEKKRQLLAGFALSDKEKTADRIRAIEFDAKLAGELTEKAEVNVALAVGGRDRKSTRLNSSHGKLSRMPSSA